MIDLLASVPTATLAFFAGAFDPTLVIADLGSDLGRTFGRVHALVVHFPLSLGLVAVAAEWWRTLTRREGLSPLTLPLLTITAIAAVFAAGTGWINASFEYENDGGTTLQLHRWIGLASAVAFVGLAVWCRVISARLELASAKNAVTIVDFRWTALAAALALGVAGHFGGELVHGTGYTTELLFPSVAKPEEAPNEADVAALTSDDRYFLEKVRPILEAHCIECHGPRKQKGGMRLDSKAWLFNGTQDKWAVIPGKSAESLLVHRVELERIDPDAMPPEGDGLNVDEQAVIRKWIDDGAAYPEVRAGGGGGGAAVGGAAVVEIAPAVRAKAEAAAKALIARGVLVQPVAADSPLFDINASRAEPAFSDADAALFVDIAPVVANLNLAKSAITDAGIAQLRGMRYLERLRLDFTAVGDVGLQALGTMPRLESINLVGSKVTPALAQWIASQPALRRVYVWQTTLDDPAATKTMTAGGKIEIIGADLPLAQPKGPPMPEDAKPDAPKTEAPKTEAPKTETPKPEDPKPTL